MFLDACTFDFPFSPFQQSSSLWVWSMILPKRGQVWKKCNPGRSDERNRRRSAVSTLDGTLSLVFLN